MWNVDIETRIRDLHVQANDRHARLVDTMTETDGSAKSGRVARARIVERLKQAFASSSRSSRPIVPYQRPAVSSK